MTCRTYAVPGLTRRIEDAQFAARRTGLVAAVVVASQILHPVLVATAGIGTLAAVALVALWRRCQWAAIVAAVAIGLTPALGFVAAHNLRDTPEPPAPAPAPAEPEPVTVWVDPEQVSAL